MEAKFKFAILLVLCFAMQVQCIVNCSYTGAGRFADLTDTTCKNYTLCIRVSGTKFMSVDYVCPTNSMFKPSASQCTTNYTCTVTNVTVFITNCTAEGYFLDRYSSNCSSYILCVKIEGIYVGTRYSCPKNTYYNPNSTLCESDYNCRFMCTSAGRFENIEDRKCKTYYYCVHQPDGNFLQYKYTCPSKSVFSPITKLCTTSYMCRHT